MGSSPPLSPAFTAAFHARAGASATLAFDAFMDLALYHPELGYYRHDRPRVGTARGTDFYTATSTGPLFGELVSAAACTLLARAGLDPATHTFVEIGAEPATRLLGSVAHPFAATRELRLGAPLALAGPCVVFSNELFDAQPLRRFVRHDAAWLELGVTLRGDQLHEVPLAPASAADLAWLPASAPEGYHFDAPRAAAALAATLAAPGWTGLFLAFDYGKTFAELASDTPQGTLRAYHRHTQSNDLLAQPGEQDLTGHVCWDWLASALRPRGFAAPTVESQEAFFIRHAATFLEHAMTAEAATLSPRKLALMQLLHPAKMGQKFQALHAVRAGLE